MFTAEERAAVREELLGGARADVRIVAAAVTGSGAAGAEDEWSDVDLAFAMGEGVDLNGLLLDWTQRMYAHHGAAHHTDVWFGTWIYRVFLLGNGLQVDLAFAPEKDFRAFAPTFRLVFGESREAVRAPVAKAEDLIGMAWLHAVHARSAIGRGRVWQAEYMISGTRDFGLALACLREGLSTHHGRGFDALSADSKAAFEAGLVRALTADELARALSVVTEALLEEVRRVDAGLAERLRSPLTFQAC
jgi:hypothetical protein